MSLDTCHDFVARFRRALRADRLDRLLTTMLRPRLLVLDEVGYTPLERPEATFLFEVVAKRYDRRKPMIITSNKSWGAWGEILPDQVMTAAILDRLLHRPMTISFQARATGSANTARPDSALSPSSRKEVATYRRMCQTETGKPLQLETGVDSYGEELRQTSVRESADF